MINTNARGILLVTILAFAVTACSQQTGDKAAAEAKAEASTGPTQPAGLPRTASVEGAGVFFISPADGDTLTNPITVEFGIKGMDVIKAGENAPHSGHHHLIIDAGLPELGLPIPADEHYVHFGDASTSTELILAPGTHSLRLLLGDYLHIPHEPPIMSDAITVTVE